MLTLYLSSGGEHSYSWLLNGSIPQGIQCAIVVNLNGKYQEVIEGFIED